MSAIKTVVIGAGHLGKIHARLAHSLDSLQVLGVVDPNPAALAEVTSQTGLPGYTCLSQVPESFSAAIVAAPTQLHHAIVEPLLKQGVHVLVEKPITVSVAEADELVAAADASGAVLQVGHVERFNPAFQLLQQHVQQAKYLETRRLSEYTFRSTDVGVVLDLMIHDLDLVLTLVDSPLKQVDAIGISIMGDHEDIAQARLEFENGSVAQLTASRCSFAKERSIQVFGERGYAQADLTTRQVTSISPDAGLLSRSVDFLRMPAEQQQDVRQTLFSQWLPKVEQVAPEQNAILEEQSDFANSILEQRRPIVSGRHGARALEAARWIINEIEEHAWQGDSFPVHGPLAIPRPRLVGGASQLAGESDEQSVAVPQRRAG